MKKIFNFPAATILRVFASDVIETSASIQIGDDVSSGSGKVSAREYWDEDEEL